MFCLMGTIEGGNAMSVGELCYVNVAQLGFPIGKCFWYAFQSSKFPTNPRSSIWCCLCPPSSCGWTWKWRRTGPSRRSSRTVVTGTEVTLKDSLVEKIRNLEPAYHAAVAEEDTDKYVNITSNFNEISFMITRRALNYCRIFTEISEALLSRMLEQSRNNNGAFNGGNLFNLLDLVLICVGHHDYEVMLLVHFNGILF